MRTAVHRMLMAFLAFAIIFSFSTPAVMANDSSKHPVNMVITQDIKYSNTPIDLTVTITYSDNSKEERLADSWHSSAPSIAYVKDNKLYFNGYNGEVTITAYWGNLSASKTINVMRYPADSLTHIQIEGNLEYSEHPVQLFLRGFYSDNTSGIIDTGVTWRSSNTIVATVDSSGKLTFTGENGTTVISAKFGKFEDMKTVTVNNPVPQRIYIIGDINDFASPTPLFVRAYYSNGTNKIVTHGVKWKTSNSSIATVSEDGVVTFHRDYGYVTITAEYLGRTASVSAGRDGDTIQYLIMEGDLKFSTKRSRQITVKAVRVDDKTVTLNPKDVIWISSDPDIATIDQEGYITFNGKSGNLAVTVMYQGKTATRYTYISAPKIEKIEFTNTFPSNAKSIQLKIRAVYEGSYGTVDIDPSLVEWSSSNKNVATVSEEGLLEFTGYGGKAQITAKYRDLEVSTVVEREGLTYEQVHRKKAFASNIDTFAVVDNIKNRKNSTAFNQTTNFSDAIGHWAESEIHLAKKLGIVTGYEYNMFVPNQDITRAEFVTYLANALGIEGKKGTSKFKDVRGHWAEATVNAVNQLGIVNGYSDGTFKPDAKITRAEIVAILCRVIDFANVSRKYNVAFEDTRFHWADEAIKQLADVGVVRGISDTEFRPNKYATRAETVVLILRVLRLDSEIAKLI